MHADDLVIDDCGARQTVERVTKCLPELHTETTTALVIEAVYPVDACTLMVPSKNEEVLWVLDFVCEEKTDNLKRLLSTINIVAKE